MQATAIAQPNIALVKYWGKRDLARNLPAAGSISITLSGLETRATVDFGRQLSTDELFVNSSRQANMLPRISACLDNVAGRGRSAARIDTRSNFPIAAGLASSASAFAAVTVAAARAAGRDLDTLALARIAGAASGSAARSLYGGFAELRNAGDTIEVASISDPNRWPLKVVIAVTERGPKAVGSTEAMEVSRKTSPFYQAWIDAQDNDLAAARAAIEERDFARLAAVAEHSCLKMHSVMWASRPPMVYWNASTLRCMQAIRQMQQDGCDVFFTIDAGPQIKAVCLPESVAEVKATLGATTGVQEVVECGLGADAHLVETF